MSTLAYGSWPSPITAAMIAKGGVTLSEARADGADAYWLEGRPSEQGRSVVVRNGEDVTPPGFSARTRVHEYGGGSYLVHDGIVWFSNFADQRLYRQEGGGAPVALTPEGARFADGVFHDGAIYTVRETHDDTGVRNEIVAVDASAGTQRVIATGRDFYSFPRVHGDRIAFTCWDIPDMPWDGTELWVANLDGSDAHLVAGGREESIFQPEWSPDSTLHWISDRSDWWNLYTGTGPVAPTDAEFGLPQWMFGLSTYTFLPDGRLICRRGGRSGDRLAILEHGALRDIETPYTSIGSLRAAGEGRVVFCGGAPTRPTEVVRLDVTTGQIEVLKRSRTSDIDPEWISVPRAIEFPTTGDRTAHALYYPAHSPDHDGPPDERPPLVVMSHGGPTSATSSVLNLSIQFWTSRGFAVVDVNYGGSTGYGRRYRQRLNGTWGIVDVDDCVNAARFLADRGEVDGARMAIRGGSAGGYTTLCALAFRDVFAAGASYFGVADAGALARDTHKFESRYLDSLIGPWPEAEELYRERSPIFHMDGFSCPILILQGLEDAVVPPSQAEMMVDALRARGVPFAYLAFEGEQHGFRQATTQIRALEAEAAFYARVFGFEIADETEPLEIENL